MLGLNDQHIDSHDAGSTLDSPPNIANQVMHETDLPVDAPSQLTHLQQELAKKNQLIEEFEYLLDTRAKQLNEKDATLQSTVRELQTYLDAQQATRTQPPKSSLKLINNSPYYANN